MTTTLAIHGGKPVRTEPFPSWPVFGDEEERRLIGALRTGAWGKLAGDEVRQFEQQFAEYHQAKYAIAVVTGTVGLRLALIAAGIQAGDEVIVPPYTFLATASAVVEANATPVFADIELESFNLDPRAVEAAVTPRTRAIIPVHVAGLPCNMDALMEIAHSHDLTVIEDACHAHGAEYKGRRVGAIGRMGVFSFQSSKNLTSGEGGIVITNDDELAARLWSAHNCGRMPDRAWYEHFTIGGNYRLSEFQGAVLNAQWDRFEQQAETRERNSAYLAERLRQIPGIVPQERSADCTRHGYHLFALRLDGKRGWGSFVQSTQRAVSANDPRPRFPRREVFLEALQAEGIPCSAGYMVPLYRQPLFQNEAFGPYTGCRSTDAELDYRQTVCPNCETISSVQGVWLEHRLLLGTTHDMDDIVAAFEKVYENRNRLWSPFAPRK